MIDPIAVGQTLRYVSKRDVVYVEDKQIVDGKEVIGKKPAPNPNPTIWLCGAIDSIQKAQITTTWMDIEKNAAGENKLVRSKNSFVNSSDFDIVRYGLKGFENFGQVEFKTETRKFFDRDVQVVSDETLKQIPLEIIRELAEVIWEGNHVDKELAGN